MITTMALVKTLARDYTTTSETAPTTAASGEVGDRLLDTVTGYTYDLTAIVVVVSPNSTTYIWTKDTSRDSEILLTIGRVEIDYMQIRGCVFAVDESDAIVYPQAADYISAEMACYILGYGGEQGRGKNSESLGGRSATYERKIFGYPISIVSGIVRYQGFI